MVDTAKIKQLMYDDTRWEAEDYDLWERALEAGWQMSNVPEVLLHYRVHPSQISAQRAVRQQQLTQEIRRRYWQFVTDAWQLDRAAVDAALNIFESSARDKNIDAVDLVFSSLLLKSEGEARAAVLHHMTRFYLTAAVDCPSVVARWRKLNIKFGSGLGLSTQLKLWIFRVFKIRAGGSLFKLVRKFYVWRASQ